MQKLFAQEEINQNPNDAGLVDFLLLHSKAAQTLQQKFNIRWFVIKKSRSHKNKRVQLVYDGSHVILQEESSPIHYFLLDAKHRLKLHTTNTTCGLPSLTLARYKKKRVQDQAPLWQLLGHHENPSQITTDPQTITELQTFLDHHTLPKTRVIVHFVHDPLKENTTEWYTTPVDGHSPYPFVTNILAWTNEDYTVVYSKNRNLSLEKAQRQGKKIELLYAKYQERLAQIDEQAKKQPDCFQTNCASSINLSHSGLNLAYRLGLIASCQDLSSALVKTHSSLYVFLDEKHHLRHVTYYDQEESFSTQVTCFKDKSDETLNAYEQLREKERRRRTTTTRGFAETQGGARSVVRR